MADCAVLGLFMLVTTNLAAIIAFATPYWIRHGSLGSQGLWAFCQPDFCTWVFQDVHRSPYMAVHDTVWWKSSQGTMCVGLALCLLCVLVATVALCCECHGCRTSLVVAVMLIVAAISFAIAVTVFGVCSNYHLYVDLDSPLRFGWSFWLALSACALALFTSIVYAIDNSSRAAYRNRC